MSTTNEGQKALSANASSFNPPSSDQIWGAISQSFGGGGGGDTHTGESGSSRPPSSNGGRGGGGGHGSGGGHGHHRNGISSHQPSHGGPPQGGGGAGAGDSSGLGLWNFGGFGDEAKNRPAPQAGRGGMLDDSNVNLDFMGEHGNKVSMEMKNSVH